MIYLFKYLFSFALLSVSFTYKDQNNLNESYRASNFLKNEESKYCLKPECVKSAASLLKNIDETIDPCDDFYQFACGNWIKNHIIPEDKSTVSTFSLLHDDLNNKLKNLIENIPSSYTTPIYLKISDLYKSCMNLEKINEQGSAPLSKLFDKFGGYPVLEGENWSEENFNWFDTLIKFRYNGLGTSIFYKVSVSIDYKENTKRIVELDQASLGIGDRTYYLRGLNDTTTAAYYKFMVDSAVLLGAKKEVAEREMLDVLKFETHLANYSLPREQRRNYTLLYNKMKISFIQHIAPSTSWIKLFNLLVNQTILNDEKIVVNVPSYVYRLDSLISKTPKRILANYMMWRVAQSLFPYLGKEQREIYQEYNKVLTGQKKEKPRWQKCISDVKSISYGVASLYVKKYFSEDSKKMTMQMVEYIHKQVFKILEKIDWMNESTRQKALEKAKKILPYIGYPDEILDMNLIDTFYQKLKINAEDYFENILKLKKWLTDHSYNKLRKPNLKGDWEKVGAVAVVNAYYDAVENAIEFPAGILQGIFFHKDRPNYLNYAAIGLVIGHEITHGFDDKGRQFDKDGNNVNWWDEETDLNFKKRAQCIINQYGNYTVPENNLKLNGINTQGENIADNGGIKQAFYAYREYVKDYGEELPLPGLNYTSEQLFWIGGANIWCGKHRPEILKLNVITGSHSPARFRVIGPFSNIKEFSESFQCPLGSRMNPVNKCSVW